MRYRIVIQRDTPWEGLLLRIVQGFDPLSPIDALAGKKSGLNRRGGVTKKIYLNTHFSFSLPNIYYFLLYMSSNADQLPQLSSGARATLGKESILGKAFGLMAKNPYSTTDNPQGIVNAGIAANKTITKLLVDKLNTISTVIDTDLEYNSSQGTPELLKEIAGIFNRHFRPNQPVKPDHIVVTNGCTAAIEMLAFAMCEPGDHVLIPAPCYAALKGDMGTRAQVNAVSVDVPLDMAMDARQVELLEQAIADIDKGKAKALFLMSPHNPLGVCYPKKVLQALLKFASRHKLFVIMDEIYALSVFDHSDDATPFESVLSWPDLDAYIDPSSVVVIHGLSKDFGLNGFRMGWIVSPWNKDILAVLCNYAPFGYRAAYSDRLIAELLSDHEFIDQLLITGQKNLAENYKHTVGFCKDNNVEYFPCTAGHFVWIRLPARACSKTLQSLGRIASDEVPKVKWSMYNELIIWESLISNERVYMPPGQIFCSKDAGWFRLTFAVSKPELKLALDRLSRGCFL